jgi:calcineurin-like phosphoesterase family protein
MNFTVENFEISPQNQLYFTSDLHFFHKRIVEFTGRPTTFENLTSWIIQQCNSVVPEQFATVVHLGDMFFGCTTAEAADVLEQLHGNWWFVLGNHDNPNKLQEIINLVNAKTGSKHRILGWYHRILVKTPPKQTGQKWAKKLLVLCHFPIEEWDGMSHGAYMIHGHLHGGGSEHSEYPLKRMPNRFDVGIDNSHSNTPFSYEEMRQCVVKGRNKINNVSTNNN